MKDRRKQTKRAIKYRPQGRRNVGRTKNYWADLK
jgi:hypothetical protein